MFNSCFMGICFHVTSKPTWMIALRPSKSRKRRRRLQQQQQQQQMKARRRKRRRKRKMKMRKRKRMIWVATMRSCWRRSEKPRSRTTDDSMTSLSSSSSKRNCCRSHVKTRASSLMDFQRQWNRQKTYLQVSWVTFEGVDSCLYVA